jgi:hypothetical protein
MPTAGENAIFLAYFLLGEQKKVRRGAGRSARGSDNLSVIRTRSPVPAGCRITFFTGLKKVTKERTYSPAVGISYAVAGPFTTVMPERKLISS